MCNEDTCIICRGELDNSDDTDMCTDCAFEEDCCDEPEIDPNQEMMDYNEEINWESKN